MHKTDSASHPLSSILHIPPGHFLILDLVKIVTLASNEGQVCAITRWHCLLMLYSTQDRREIYIPGNLQCKPLPALGQR